MFEIGTSLREARLRRKVELSQVERDTHIRAKYLMALEDDRFEALPGAAYAKGFLRTYADYLGLDGAMFVDEFNARFVPEDEPAPPAPTRIRPRAFAHGSWLFAVPVAAALVAVVAWELSSGAAHRRAPLRPRPTATHARLPPTRPPGHRSVAERLRVARIVVTASRGPCWLDVRKGSATGPQVFERTLQPNESARFVARRLWVRLGAPWNADATLNGKPVRLPTAIADVLVTSRGITLVA